MPVELIDLSNWNTVTDWAALKASGVEGVILKVSEGITVLDGKFATFAGAAIQQGMSVMAYHFFRGNLDGVAQADFCWGALQPLRNALGFAPVVWVDVETVDGVSNATRISRLAAFLSRMETLQGQAGKVGIYTSPGYANVYLTPTPAWVNDYWHWVAHWTSGLPASPAGWLTIKRVLHQYGVWNDHSWVLPVAGCNPDIDRNRWGGSVEALRVFAGVGEPVEPEYVTWDEFEALAAVVDNLTDIIPTHIISGAGTNGEKFRATPGGNERWMVPNGTPIKKISENASGGALCEMVFRGRVEVGWVDKENLTPL